LTWDGTKRIGKLLDGNYQAVVVLAEAAGPVTHSLPFVADSRPPSLRLLSVHNLVRFRLGEDGTVTLTVGARSYSKQAKAGIVAFWLRKPPRHFTAVASDAAGNVSGPIRR